MWWVLCSVSCSRHHWNPYMVHLPPPPPPPPPPFPLAACPRTYLWESKMINTCYFKGTHFVCTTCHYNTKRIVLRLTCMLFKAFPCLYIIIAEREAKQIIMSQSMNFGVCMHVLYIILNDPVNAISKLRHTCGCTCMSRFPRGHLHF